MLFRSDGGLRVSEVINLKIADIDSKQMKITIRQSKGRKDRQIKLSVILLKYLRDYAREYKPNLYLFNGQNGELQYSIRSCQKLFHNYAEKAGIKRKIKFHENRHGYAMSLLENGTDIERIKDLLGHSSSKTTRIYARMNNNVIQRELSPMEQIVGANAIESKYNILHNAT